MSKYTPQELIDAQTWLDWYIKSMASTRRIIAEMTPEFLTRTDVLESVPGWTLSSESLTAVKNYLRKLHREQGQPQRPTLERWITDYFWFEQQVLRQLWSLENSQYELSLTHVLSERDGLEITLQQKQHTSRGPQEKWEIWYGSDCDVQQVWDFASYEDGLTEYRKYTS